MSPPLPAPSPPTQRTHTTCPHCGHPGISLQALARSSAGWPATCTHCRQLSHGPGLLRRFLHAFSLQLGGLVVALLLCLLALGHYREAAITTPFLLIIFLLARHSDYHIRPITAGRAQFIQKLVLRTYLFALFGGVLWLVLAHWPPSAP